jgi:peptidoglycan/xylan/chitin deacetylase (PgdA/CDA1 family)
MRTIRVALTLLFLAIGLPGAAGAESHAIVLLYHHVDADAPESTSVTPVTFERHLAYLWDNNFFVLPLEEILDAMAAGESLPENAIAITFDDAYESVHRVAWPMLRERRWPFTVFVSTNYIDAGYGNYMSWSQIRELTDSGGTIGNHSLAHAYPLDRLPGENKTGWLARFREDLLAAAQRIEDETGETTKLYAYPYGEFSAEVEGVIDDLGWYGVGQQSGAIGPETPLTSAPRFPISTSFSGQDDFALRVHARPLPVRVIAPADRLLGRGERAPVLELELTNTIYAPATIGCYTSDGNPIEIRWQNERRFRIQAQASLEGGRSKYTCTAPYPAETGVYGWYSHLWIAPNGGD